MYRLGREERVRTARMIFIFVASHAFFSALS
jgi:hypothetical protein